MTSLTMSKVSCTPYGMDLPDSLTPDGSPDTIDSPTFITPASSARPSVIESVRDDREGDGGDRDAEDVSRGTLGRMQDAGDLLAAFQAKQDRALAMLRSDSSSSHSWGQLDMSPYSLPRPRSAEPYVFLEPPFASALSQQRPTPRVSAHAHAHVAALSMASEDGCLPASLAPDAKKEPSIRPSPALAFPPFETKAYPDPTMRGRASQIPHQAFPSHGHTSFPLTGKAAVTYHSREDVNVATAHPVREKFTDTAAYWLGLYFLFNLGLTLFNKIVLVSFPFPYTLTGLHALSGCAGCYLALERGAFTPARLTSSENLILAAFSVLYTINIAVSNLSLQLVTVPFHQVVRASTPLFTIIIAAVLLRARFTTRKLVSLLPVVAGVGFATYGDYYFTAWGLILTLLGTFLAALKTVVTNLIQTGGGGRLKLHPLDLLMRMSPLAFIQCVIYAWYTGELERVRIYGATQMTRTKAVALLVNGVIACGLNIVSFTANKKAGALTMTVSANCKQVMTIALAVVLFDLNIAPMNGLGIILTLIGGGWYGWVEYTDKRKPAKAARA